MLKVAVDKKLKMFGMTSKLPYVETKAQLFFIKDALNRAIFLQVGASIVVIVIDRSVTTRAI